MMTSGARNGLNARIIPHENQSAMGVTSTGLLKGEHGLVIPPSHIDAAAHSAMAKLTDTEESMFAVVTAAKEQEVREQRKARRKTKQSSVQAPVETHVDTNVSIIGSGIDVPTQYAHVYEGTGIAVLVCNKYSYVPVKATTDADGIKNCLRLSGTRGIYAFMGHEFQDADGARNLILIRLPDELGEEEESEDDE